jgi:hypothetical protein
VVRRLVLLALLAELGACTSFQDPTIVLDLRTLAMQSSVPEQVIDIDFSMTPDPQQLLGQLVPNTVCALVSDPEEQASIRWAMTLCAPTDDERCDPDHPSELLGAGVIADPDTTVPEPQLCATIQPDGGLLTVLLDALDQDTLDGFSGLDYSVQLEVGEVGAASSDDQLASKTIDVAARVPADRMPNHNPYLDHLDVYPYNPDGSLGDPERMPLGRCVDQTAPLQVVPTQAVRFEPVEPPGVRETYVVPTLSGGSQTFTESLTYQWLATDGGFYNETTGGPPDVLGNPAVLYNDWQAPGGGDITLPEDISLWIVQRDERLGVQWYETCVEVVGLP